jgi:hypothetical protein
MRSKVFCVLLGVGFGILGAGCQMFRGPKGDVSTGGSCPFPTDPKELVIDPRNGDVLTRWIGLRSLRSKGCPEVKGWRGEPLLSPALAKSRDDFALITELGLDRFCVYTPQPGSYRPFVAPPDLKASMDRLAISMAGEDLVPGSPLTDMSHLNRVDQALSKEFLLQAGQLPPDSSLLSGPPNVQITFLDTEPDGPLASSPPTPPGSQHGFAVAHLAQDLVCKAGDGPCAATILNKRALNYGDPKSLGTPLAPDQRGSVGLVSDLTVAITEAVLARPKGKRLILNLSIGWDGETDLDGKDTLDRDTPAQSVYGALQLALRKHVLVIAAAGNRRGGRLDDSNWPILPAAWDLWPSGRQSKLIYAVGGVDWQGLPLPNSRTNALPVRVAYGDHATVKVGNDPAAYTTVYTGSSVSTAVVSATAAMIWHLRPDLTPAQVMGLIDGSGETLKARADFYPGSQSPSPPPAPPIREISLCAAVKVACSKSGLNCSTPACPPQHQPPALSALLSQEDPGSGTPFEPAVLPPASLPPCYQGTVLLTAGDSVSQPICPTDQYGSVSAQPWVLPQPGDDPCPNCALVPGPPKLSAAAVANLSARTPAPQLYQLAISVSPSWLTKISSITTAMLDIDCFDPGTMKMKRTTYPVEVPMTGPSAPNPLAWTVFRLGDGNSLNNCRAQLNLVIDENGSKRSIQNPVVVDPDFSPATDAVASTDGSTRSVSAPSTNVVKVDQQEKRKATNPPF